MDPETFFILSADRLVLQKCKKANCCKRSYQSNELEQKGDVICSTVTSPEAARVWEE